MTILILLINIAKNFSFSGTLMYITLLNNGVNGKKTYCRDIESISVFPFEKEIIITTHCQFTVTGIKRNQDLDYLYLNCTGFDF